MRPFLWLTEAVRAILVLLSALAIGLLTDSTWPVLAIVLAGLLAWHALQAIRLFRWLEEDEETQPHFPSGLWQELSLKLRSLTLRNRKRKKTLSRFFKRLRGAAQAFPQATVVLGRDEEIEWCNPAAARLLDIHWPADRGRRLSERIQLPELFRYLKREEFEQPLEFSPPNNRAMVLSLTVTPFGKKRYQRLLVIQDITRIHNLDRTRRDFIANASHELRTPLTVIYGYLEALTDESAPNEEWRRPLELMLQQTERMQHLVNDLLALSRLETDPSAPVREPVNVPRLIREIAEDAGKLAADSQHVLHLEIDPKLWIKGTADELQSAFGNLVSNAIQHTPAGTEIRISWQQEAAGPCFTVRDNGGGIEKHHIPRLTERFFRVDKARSRASGGTGLGLAIVKQIIQRYGGQLLIDSEPGVGTSFKCRFPISLLMPYRENP